MERLIDRLIKQFVPEGVPVGEALRAWYRQSGYWYTTSFLVHAIGFVVLAIVLTLVSGCPGIVHLGASQPNEVLTLESSNVEEGVELDVARFEIGEAPLNPTTLSLETLLAGPQAPQKAVFYDESDAFVEEGGGKHSELSGMKIGGLGGFQLPKGPGPAKAGGLGVSDGDGDTPGAGGGRGLGLGPRGKGSRERLGGTGITPASEKAVAGGLNWLARHQSPAGNWSLQHTKHCKGGSCSGPGRIQADSGATAMALLAFLGTDQTHKKNGPYRQHVGRAIAWLLKHQNARTGDLSAGAPQPMYSHGLATIALCEAYAMTRDESVGKAAVNAVRFIERAQNEVTGAWRYVAGSHDGDTSVLGWQIMALKSAQMAGIGVNSMAFEGARKWLASVAEGKDRGLYKYQPYKEVSPSMTAVGMLCQQYLGIAGNDPSMIEGKQYLLANLPDANLRRDIYYWYYATLTMHNFVGPEWDRWNRQVRRTLITTQCKGGCVEGSWDPERPTIDTWSDAGRVYVTALSTLTLEVYYRYLPLFKFNQGPAAPQPPDKMSLVIGLPAAPAPDKPARQTP